MKTIYIKLFSIIVPLWLFVVNCFSQEFTGSDAYSKVQGAELVKVNINRNTIDFVRLSPSYGINESNFYLWMVGEVLKTDNKSSIQLTGKETDKYGFTHYHYKQFYKSLPVEYGVYHAHLKDGKLQSVNGEYYGSISVDINPSISKKSAFEKALARINATKYKDDNSQGLSATREKGELLIFPLKSTYHLAYKFDIYALEPLKREYIYIDAKTGDVLFEENRIHNADAHGTANTGFSGTRQITTDSISPTVFHLNETGRGNGIHTWNLNNGSNYASATEFTDADNVWNSTSIDKYAYDAHFGAEMTYDFYLNNFGRNSYDNLGAVINSYVHYTTNYVNAFWDGTEMTYGDGDGVEYYPLTSLEICGHEITHAVTEHTAALVYSGESGALNESFSDVFGNTIRFLYTPTSATWYCADQIVIPGSTGTPFRNLANPNDFDCADTYGGTWWNNGDIVHYNSGVQNFWYYLLCDGGSGVNDIGNTYTVNGIGLHDASAIAYRNLSVYLTANATFADARFYAIQSAVDLFGNCSNQVIQTTNAWYAVGVGGIFSNAVVAGFSAAQNYFCTLPANVSFSNNSLNSTSYNWNFGDGSAVSTLTNPTHSYTSAGTYTVRLIASGSASCSSIDTLIMTNYIVVTNSGGPVTASCNPATTSNCCGIGITNVQFGSINKTSGNASEGYRDFTCGNVTTIIAGDPVQLSVTTGTTNYENVKAWIDYDNNGILNTATEQVFSSINILHNHSGIVYTHSTAVLNTPLRMRVMDDNYTYSSYGPCTDPQNGQAEDYTVIFNANTQKPIADFTSNVTVINVGGTVNFYDLTIHAPVSWQWTFPGGTPASSNVQNPSIVFNTLGTYQVKLKATNSFGSDSIIKTAYISVVSAINLCTGITFTSSSSGQIYDSGGPTGNYSDNENCSLLIDPGCAISITLSFTQFNTESCCDYMRVYNGTSTSDPLILNVSGGSIPSAVTASSGKMLITWQTDFSGHYSGWEGQWTSVLGSSSPPVAAFTMQSSNPPLATPLQFTDHTTNIPISWAWDFGDGQTSTSQNPVHSYLSPGNYSVRLIANNCITSDTVNHPVTVQGAPIISTNPDSVSVNLGCNDTITIPVTIYNTGTGDLVYNINGSTSSGAIRILAMTYGVDLSMEYPNTITAISTNFTNYTLDTTNTITASVLQSLLPNKDVLLFPEQESGITTYYASLSTVVQNFANSGGTVIICGSQFSGSENLIYDLGLFTGNFMSVVTSGNAPVTDTSDDIMDGIPLNISLTDATFTHNFTNSNKIELVTYTGADVVTYRHFGNGKVIYVGFDYYAFNAQTQRIISNAVRYAISNSLPSWVSMDSLNGIITPGDSTILNVTFYSNGLPGGIYTSNIIINSNDPLHPVDTIPLTLHVGNSLCANFIFNTPSICSGVVSFRDTSFNTPTSWLWDFGDGSTSVLQYPTHYYTAPGTYTVQLVACNATSCDSVNKQVTITSVNGPQSAWCTPTTTGNCCGMGITHVVFNTINKTSPDGVEGYMDNTCTNTTTVTIGLNYSLTVTTGTQYNENTRAWIDFNNNGMLEDPAEKVMTSDNLLLTHSAIVIIPSTAVANVPLRMRISSDYYVNASPTPCSNQQYGQTEDYSVFIQPNTMPPVADFNVSVVNTCTGQVNFTDISGNTPTSWYWTFGDGASSTLQNPIHQYLNAGTFMVTLIATNPYGADTIALSATVNVLNASISVSNNLIVGQTIMFTSGSVGATNYLWNFDDGYLSSLAAPYHVYTSSGMYIVSLNVSNALCSLTVYDTLYIGVDGIGQIKDLQTLYLIPNPFQDEINISYKVNSPKTISIEAYDIAGKSMAIIVNNQYQDAGKYNFIFSPPASGIYIIKFTVNKESVFKRVVKVD